MSRLLLFDIDNTLLYSGGAGSLAMAEAFRDQFGIENGFGRVEFSGRTDRYILAEALRQHRISGDYEAHEAGFLERYYALLPAALRQRKGRLMPGFPGMLDALSRREGVRLGLATGNFSGSAELKLKHFGIWRYFEGGGFGEESEDRADMVAKALERLADGLSPADVVVIGDTPHDISSAKANGAVAVGVATGSNSVDELRASGASFVFRDFSDWEQAVAKLTGGL